MVSSLHAWEKHAKIYTLLDLLLGEEAFFGGGQKDKEVKLSLSADKGCEASSKIFVQAGILNTPKSKNKFDINQSLRSYDFKNF